MSIKIKDRGPAVAIQISILISGIAFAYWLDFGFTRLTSQVSWVKLQRLAACINALS